MEYHKPRLPLISVLIISCALFFLIKPSEEIFQTNGLDGTEKRLAVHLINIYEETKDVESIFYENVDRVHNMFEEIKKKNNMNNNDDNSNVRKNKYDEENIDTEKASPLNPYLAASFVEMQSKGPVEEETIWRALYDTQLRRSPPTEEVHVFSSEDIKKEYNEAKMDSFISQIDMMKSEFDKNLNYMNAEMFRQKNKKKVLHDASLFDQHIKKMNNKRICKNGPLKKEYSTQILC
ncbi:hypothetical protein PRSY57_0107800 [Plasmodium reichenowi]|uniref:Uncharacterized protein n=1 Tax=Plasmodium reichenowi TaxID=5854 RepID=A0A151LW76_PLARE|nr:hypothetical protein PRSY57_0107800 [Plasmodium reichenowi]KYO03431.1 hypothetical protein PRSY57_0107800 [Plasmodium reichenowi]